MSERSDFERERDRLVAEIAESLAKAVTSVNQLNRNIESVNSVGQQFDSVSNLWTKFSQVMYQPVGSQEETIAPERILERDQDQQKLPAGVVPGGGDPILSASTSSHR
ncbi:Dad1p [Sporobolomyces salmoneus]|uniref:Dad1p n=1 Tax=Sporobolomyces salmoneus TaxID=183962 RepID=UPI00318201C1